MLNIAGFGLSVGFDISGCSESVSVGPDATTVCSGVVSTAIISGVNSGDEMISTNLNAGFEFNHSHPTNGINMSASTTSSVQGLPSGIPIEEYQKQLGESLKRTFLTDCPVTIIIHRTNKNNFTINMTRKATMTDIKSKLNIPLSACIHWNGIQMENHYPIGYFVTEPLLHLKLL